MKRFAFVLAALVLASGMAFAADEPVSATVNAVGAVADTAVNAAADAVTGTTAAVAPVTTPVAQAAVDVTKGATGVVEQGIDRRQTRRETRRATLFGMGDKKQGTVPTSAGTQAGTTVTPAAVTTK